MANNPTALRNTRAREWKTFLFITIILFPLLSIVSVGGYGFAIWFLQILTGPPGHG